MVKKVGRFFRGSKKSTEKSAENSTEKDSKSAQSGGDRVRILKKGHAMRVIFFYPGEEGTYVDNCDVTLYENGIIHIASNQEETTTHLQNCEILWRFETEAEDRANKLRLLKPKAGESAKTSDAKADADAPHADKVAEKIEGKPGKGSAKNPELR
jgi:hypothetical protein